MTRIDPEITTSTAPRRELQRLLRAHPRAEIRAIAPADVVDRPLVLSDVHYEHDARIIVQVLS